MYLGELCLEVMQVFGIEISPSTLSRTLKRYGLTRKKMIHEVALQRSSELRKFYGLVLYSRERC